jgi:mono/diheme cytochrome c family protein
MKLTKASGFIPLLCLLLLICESSLAAESGEQLFLNNCAECHQRDGRGIKNIYPSLAGNKLVLGSAVDVALVLMIGRGEMPSFKGAIPSEELATIINYVRNAWGNSGKPISSSTIDSL